MQVNPTDPGRTSGPRAKQPEKLTKEPPDKHRQPSKPTGTSRDNAEISGAARNLAGILKANRPTPTELHPERMRQILDRIASGFYGRLEIQQKVVSEIARHLGVRN